MSLRVALFVEGSENRAIRRGPLLPKIWRQLGHALGIEGFSRVEPISKKHLVAMDPELPTMSGAGEALDQLMARCLERDPFDAAVVAWDLVPPKDADAGFCRWRETLELYRLMGTGSVLPEAWRAAAARRHVEMMSRALPSHRRRPHRAAPYEIVAVCMDPMFEALLLQEEQKDPWLEYLLRRLLDDPEARALVLAHPICRRLSECLGEP